MKISRYRIWQIAVALTVLGFVPVAFAHKNHARHEEEKLPETPDATKELALRLESINEAYKKDIKPIFQRACFDCHSQSPHLPWYHSLPFVHSMLERDMQEAKVHLDFSDDFPFKGHGSPEEDLEAIANTIKDKSMPPLRYQIMHFGSGLGNEERKTILKWTGESEQALGQPKK